MKIDMTTPIIDPSTLTEGQREAIRRYYQDLQHDISLLDRDSESYILAGYLGGLTALENLFGKDFFKKGE